MTGSESGVEGREPIQELATSRWRSRTTPAAPSKTRMALAWSGGASMAANSAIVVMRRPWVILTMETLRSPETSGMAGEWAGLAIMMW